MNRGALGGTSTYTWQAYNPDWHATNVSGNPTMPAIGNGTKVGRFTRFTNGMVVAQVQLIFGSTTSFGNGDAYLIGLPVPANRWTSAVSSATADLPIGTALAWQGASANPSLTLPLIPTLADPLAGYNLQTNEDYYAHLFCSHCIAQGTANISGAATTAVVNHNLGLTPIASDFNVQFTARNGAAAAPRAMWVDTITPTQFTINVQIAPGGATSWDFSWAALAEPNNTGVNLPQLVSYRRPWTFASGHGVYCQFFYEARN